MSERRLPQGWREAALGSVGTCFRGRGGTRADEQAGGLPCIRYGDLYTHHDCIVRSFCSAISPARAFAYTALKSGDIVFAGSGETPEEIGKATAYCDSGEAYAGADTIIFRPGAELDSRFAGYAVNSVAANRYKSKMGQGSSVFHISSEHLSRLRLPFPSANEQQGVADVLQAIDEAIETTEALIAKTQQIRVGLMHDLFTCGITPGGQLRPPRKEAPKLYKESPLGWIPNEWVTSRLEPLLLSSIDGPFGSNLKTEHYVSEPGVRLVRLQNIGEGTFLDEEKAWISASHARSLAKHEVQPGDVLVASLGDPTHPFGRSCLYPRNHPPGIVKADCFRLRTGAALEGAFLACVLNTPRWRTGLSGLARRSGVSRDRVNLNKLRHLEIPLPALTEQRELIAAMDAAEQRLSAETNSLRKLELLKHGLMHDLLTGRVRAPVANAQRAAANV